LASGSSGNAALLQADGFGLLIDCGLSARQLNHRLSLRGLTWRDVDAVILTHTHSDHWCHSALKAMIRLEIPLYCHPEHSIELDECEHFAALRAAGLVTCFMESEWLWVSNEIRVLPHEVSHDADPTFAFRCEGQGWAMGYAADLGDWDDALVKSLADVDVLALEFNHDEKMQKTSGRPRYLIDRVLGPRGHLSNRQGAALLAAIRDQSKRPPTQGVIALHRSQQCNTAKLVEEAAQRVLTGLDLALYMAEQSCPTATIEMTSQPHVRRGKASSKPQAKASLFDD
jgi:phosphoribosyl 1,2-cyclic phosphodiesterase